MMSSYVLIKDSDCYHSYHISTCCNIYMLNEPTLKHSEWFRGVDAGRPLYCGVIHLRLRGTANGCRPCSLFSIASIQNLSTCGCILITLLSLFHFLHLEHNIPGHHSILPAFLIFTDLVEAKFRLEQHQEECHNRRISSQEAISKWQCMERSVSHWSGSFEEQITNPFINTKKNIFILCVCSFLFLFFNINILIHLSSGLTSDDYE